MNYPTLSKNFIFGITTLTLSANASVDVQSSSYKDSWIDLYIKSKSAPIAIKRNYQSRSVLTGVFGYGWCTILDHKVIRDKNNYIKILSCSDTSGTLYTQTQPAPENAPQISNVFTAGNRPFERVRKINNTYIRSLPDHSVERYNDEGRIIEYVDREGRSLKFKYNRRGHVVRIYSDIDQIQLRYTRMGRVREIRNRYGVAASYRYKGDNLVQGRSAWDNVYQFKYDEFHNLQQIEYPDDTTKHVVFDSINDRVIGFKDRNDCFESFRYHRVSRLKFETDYRKECEDSIESSSIEFQYKQTSWEETYLDRVVRRIEGRVETTVFDPRFGKPILIDRDGKRDRRKYDNKSRMVAQSTENTHKVYEYNEESQKPRRLIKINTKTKSKEETIYSYDQRDKLISAENTNGEQVKVNYDDQGRLLSIVGKENLKVHFIYRKDDKKPTSIVRPGIGHLSLEYDKKGRISRVSSRQGPKVAHEITNTLSNLLRVIDADLEQLN